MTDWQTILASCLMVATVFSHGWRIPAVWGANFVATAILAGAPLNVAVADLVVSGALIGMGTRARVVAALYIAMQPLYIVGVAFGWQASATYAIVDALAFVQLAVIGNVDGGIRGLYRGCHRRLSDWRLSVVRPTVARLSEISAQKGR